MGKGGKKKGQTLNLTEFLGNDGGATYRAPGAGNTATVNVASNWAEEMEEEGYEPPRSSTVVQLPTAPRAALGPGVEDERIPHRPPYTAYIANLPYDVDESEIKETFEKARLKIENVRLMKDEGGRLKGYGYADLADRDSMGNVLTMELSVKNRKMRIDLASQAGKDRPERGFNDDFRDRRGGGGRNDDPDAGRSDADDWRRGPPPPAREENNRYNERDRYNGRGSYDRDSRGGRGFSNYEAPRDGGRCGGFSRGADRDGGYRREEREAPKERPRLNLAPRSKPAENEDEKGSGQSSIFGGAKPVDTLKKEMEIEERHKREKEEKERAIEEAKKNKPSAASIFGSAKPVDTSVREKEIEEKLSKLTTSDSDKVDSSRAYKSNPTRRGEDTGFDRRRDDRRQPDNRGYDRDRRDDRGYDRDRRDGRGYERRGEQGSRDEMDNYRRDHETKSVERDDRTPEPLKKYEEPKPMNVVAQNKFAFLEEEDAGGDSDED